MSPNEQFDFWYAVNNTEVLQLPASQLETFGATYVNYHLLSEYMDQTDKVRVREGRIEAFRPQIITPDHFSKTMLEGFGQEAEHYAEWLRNHQQDLYILKYGFAVRKQEVNDHTISENLDVAIAQVRKTLEDRADPATALLVGVEDPWEVCLLKLMVEVVQQSFSKNYTDLRADPQGKRHEIEKAFRAAARDKNQVSALNATLKKHGAFEEYQDRFFALVRSQQ